MSSVNIHNSEWIAESSSIHKAMFNNIQCNILRSVGRELGVYLFLTFTSDKNNSRKFLKTIRHFISSTKQQFDATAKYKAAKKAGKAGEALPDELMGGLFISAEGYTHLGFDPDQFDDTDQTFRKGMKSQKSGVFDKLLDKNNKDPKVSTWEQGFQVPIHVMIMLSCDKEQTLAPVLLQVKQFAKGFADIVTEQHGKVLREGDNPENKPLEHFGYRDGISQPLFLQEDADHDLNTSDWDPSAELALVLTSDPFTKDIPDSYGSFFVFRKLKQNVEAFNKAIGVLSDTLGVNPDLAGAMVVGRFKDGTPLTLNDNPDSEINQNNFNYDKDEDGDKCPRHAHIRKVNPRGTTPFTSLENEKLRRIARRGIPYGEWGAADVGLLFMCYQADIAQQFEFIQRTWADNPNFPRNLVFPGTGDDPLIGQDFDASAEQHWPTKHGGSERKNFSFEGFVKLQGGEYFYAPSLKFFEKL